MGLSIADVNDTLSTAWASSYVNDFIDRGRIKKVYVQADANYRMLPSDLDHWYVRNSSGEMVPFSAFATSYWDYGRITSYNVCYTKLLRWCAKFSSSGLICRNGSSLLA